MKQCRITEYRDPDGVRFTKLHRYMDADFVKENPYIYLSVDGDDLIFQITALFITTISIPIPSAVSLPTSSRPWRRKTG